MVALTLSQVYPEHCRRLSVRRCHPWAYRKDCRAAGCHPACRRVVARAFTIKRYLLF